MLDGYLKSHRRKNLTILVFLAIAIIFGIYALGLGRYNLNFIDVINNLVAKARNTVLDPNFDNVVYNIRLPRVILALIAGAGLAVAGASYQALFSNPLATPDTLGVASGASFGAVLGLVMEFNLVGVQLVAMVFGLLAIILVLTIAKSNKGTSLIMIVLAGMVVGSLFQAFISLIKLTADTQDQLPAITFWLMGGLSGINWENLALTIPFILVGVGTIFLLRWRLNGISLSEDEAKSLGINVRNIRIMVIFASTAITASIVSICGQIGWVGLLIPHICRMIFGDDNRFVIPASVSLGALFFLVIDTIARAATSIEIPVSILTAIIGAPFFIILLKRTGGVRG